MESSFAASVAEPAPGGWAGQPLTPVPDLSALGERPGHPRIRIAEEVLARPGQSITELAVATSLGHTTVCHHLAVMQRRGLILRERWGGSVRVFPTNLSPTHRALLAQARAGRTGEVLRALAAEPRSTPASLARTLGLHRQAVQWHLARLEKAGIVRVDREHRPYRIALNVRPESILRWIPAPARVVTSATSVAAATLVPALASVPAPSPSLPSALPSC